jgi:signal recognition particle receptor subunit beta/predicted  nucleic acid-binding Zn-ribbon protein
MVIYNAATKELTAKIVYYGPGLCGKTTNLKVLHDRLEPGTAGKLLNLQTQTDRTIYFDLLPVELGDIKGYKIRFQLATVPGQTAFNETRKVVLKGVDGIVFVADSQWTMLPKNLESWQNLKDNLKSNEITFESIPVVIQYNKRDLADILAVDAMQEALGLSSYPYVEAVASAGRGVTETFKLISKLTFVDLLRRLQGRRAEEDAAAAAAGVDDLQTWKDSLLNRESQPTSIPAQAPQALREQRSSRPLSLVPPVSEMAPFDTTELARGVDDDEAPESPYAVPEPATPGDAEPRSSAQTIRMEAIRDEMFADAGEPIESLTEADEVEVELEPATDPSFLPSESAPLPDVHASAESNSAASARSSADAGARSSSPELEQALRNLASLQERVESTAASVAAFADRLAGMEKGVGGLNETLHSLTQRLGSIESDASRRPDPELERGLKALESRLSDLDDRLRSETTHQRKDADDVAMALRGLNERSQNLDQQLSSLSHQLGAHQGTVAQLSGLGDRLPPLESQLAAVRDALARLPELEGQQSSLREAVSRLPELDGHLGAIRDTLARLPELEAQLSALRDTSARLPELEGQIQGVLQQHHELESTLEEKTHQGRREAEDIRSQIAPLLEERVRRHESDALLFAEMERLRESLAESLHDLAERVRSRVRE